MGVGAVVGLNSRLDSRAIDAAPLHPPSSPLNCGQGYAQSTWPNGIAGVCAGDWRTQSMFRRNCKKYLEIHANDVKLAAIEWAVGDSLQHPMLRLCVTTHIHSHRLCRGMIMLLE